MSNFMFVLLWVSLLWLPLLCFALSFNPENKLIYKNIKYNLKTTQNHLIINLDDVIREYKTKDLVEIMSHMSPLLSQYKNIEFSISEIKLNEVFTNKNQLKITAKNQIDFYHECALRDLRILGKKINVDFSIIYNLQNIDNQRDINIIKNYIGLDYYISKIATMYANKQQAAYVVKNVGASLLKPYWDLSLPIKVIKIKKDKSLTLHKISKLQYDVNIPYLYNTTTFL